MTTVAADAKLAVTKSADPTSGVKAGDKVTYTVTVENTGNVTVTAIGLTDTLVDLSGEAAFELAPGDKKEDITYEYTVTQADVDAGEINNTVTATGKDPKNNDVTNTASAKVTTVAADAKLAVTKSADPTSGVKAGDKVTYTITAKNTGNVTLSSLVLTDVLEGIVLGTLDKTTIAPNETATATATYVVKQADVDAGKIDNTATVAGQDPKNTEVSDDADCTVTTVAAAPAIEVTKAADKTENVKVGDKITYTITAKNTGNVTLSSLVLTDVLEGIVLGTLDKTTIAPNETATATATYVVKQADVDAGKIDNTATVAGKDPKNTEVSDDADCTVTTVAAAPAIEVIKAADKTENVKVDDKITYTITAKNTGNVTISSLVPSDILSGIVMGTLDKTTIAPNETATVTATYIVTQADVDAGKIDNIATVAGKDPKNNEVSDDDDCTVAAYQNGHLTVTKETTSEIPEGGYKLGETVSYKITVVNDGNLTITEITVTDERTGDEWKIDSLTPGESKEYTTSTTVTEDDILSGHIINEATATGKSPDPDKPDVPVTPDETDDDPEDPEGHLTVTKETTSETPEGGYKLGETVSYKITVVNDGNLTITDIKVLDERTGDEWPVASLAPGESKEFTASTTVTEGDILSGHIINEATATGKSPDPDKPDVPVTPDETDDDPEDPEGHLTVTKETTSETPEGGYKLGETVSYKITVVNDGNLTITDIKVLDERTGDEWPVASLAPGESKEFTASTTVTEGDILDGHIINEATATGKSPDPDKPDVPVTPDETDDDPEDPNGHITIVKEATSTPEDEKGYAEGETITYKITATNDGNLTITDITVTDDLTGDKWPVESLKPGESKEFTAEYTVTAKDAAAGEVLNVATATGKSPDPEKPDVPVTPGEDPEPTVETKFTLIIRYWIGSTEGELINTVTRVEKAGTEYDVVTPPMEGYTADIAEIKGVLEKDTEYDVVYTPEDYTLTILYRFQDGTEAAETYTEVLHFGDEYSVESPVIQTYFANKQKVEGVMPARDVTVTVIYAKYPVIITIDDFETPLGIGLGSINVGETIE